MSCPEDKLHERSTTGLATCELHHLTCQFGFRVLDGTATRPLRVEVSIPGYRATWRRIPGGFYEREPDTTTEFDTREVAP
ncbi:hypothetical protein JY651_07835 [Pyxidicoccus parkwayensis]|uniref:Uncharacterized protein n=1 Tax=Pyxidicoccus parkwayensis TaxID=2813578 RepID=A0ABX7P313_9BACT|nr:hypothetical protein [Pyxidicoccus parkwaysis]QSQ24840.1 hypothetical protein JY651_07835 [Pyxidicoccus parkwaysis]